MNLHNHPESIFRVNPQLSKDINSNTQNFPLLTSFSSD